MRKNDDGRGFGSEHAERYVLGASIGYEESLHKALLWLEPEMFTTTLRQQAFECIRDLAKQSLVPDLATVQQEAAMRGLDDGPLCAELMTCYETGITPANVEHLCKIIVDRHAVGELARVGRHIATDFHGSAEDAQELLSSTISQVATSGARGGVSAREGVTELYRSMERQADGLEDFRGVATGLSFIDKNGGFFPGELVVLAGDPGSGKTAFSMQVVEHVAASNRHSIFFSLEMSIEELFRRMLSQKTGVFTSKLRKSRTLSQLDWDLLAKRREEVAELDLTIFDDPGMGISQIKACSHMTALSGKDVGLIVVDYAQLVQARGEREHERIATVARELKALAREMECPVLALSQKTRDSQRREGGAHDQLHDISGSAELANAADMVVFLSRPFTRSEDLDPSEAHAIVRKYRHGPPGKYDLIYDTSRYTFRDICA